MALIAHATQVSPNHRRMVSPSDHLRTFAHVSRSCGWGLPSWCSARISKGWTRRLKRAGQIAARCTRDKTRETHPRCAARCTRDTPEMHRREMAWSRPDVSQLRRIISNDRVGVAARPRYGGILLSQRRGALRRGELHVHARYADRVAVLAEGAPRPRAANALRPAMPHPHLDPRCPHPLSPPTLTLTDAVGATYHLPRRRDPRFRHGQITHAPAHFVVLLHPNRIRRRRRCLRADTHAKRVGMEVDRGHEGEIHPRYARWISPPRHVSPTPPRHV